jgi:single-stranded DNA-binding protein
MTSKKLTPTLLMSIAAVAATAAITQAAPPKAKITPAQAKASAVKKIPGRATAAKYEFEDGHWQYAVTVVDKTGQMYEAEVSSTTGKVTATEKTSAAEEATEAAADKKAALKAKQTGHSSKAPAKAEAGEKPD